MHYKIIFFFCIFLLTSCAEQSKKINYTKKFNTYSNKGFALIYDDKMYKNKLIDKKLNDRSLIIFNNFLKKETPVRITNLINGKYLVAKVGNNSKYPVFYNSVISKRIANELALDITEPYVEIKTLNQNNSFIINEAKTFEEEKKVADKAPVEGIEISNISNNKKTKKIKSKIKSNNSFEYIIKIADLYFLDSAKILQNRLKIEYNIINVNIKKMSKNSYRIYKGPFKKLDSLKREYNDIIKLNFENIEIIKI